MIVRYDSKIYDYTCCICSKRLLANISCLQFVVNDSQGQYVEVQCIDAADNTDIGSLGR